MPARNRKILQYQPEMGRVTAPANSGGGRSCVATRQETGQATSDRSCYVSENTRVTGCGCWAELRR